MEKRNVVIIECISSAVSYVKDILDEGCEPVLVELYVPEEQRKESRRLHDLYLQELYLSLYPGAVMPKRIQAPESYEEALEIIRALDPLLVIPGGDEGIIWATRMSRDLGLIGNDPANLDKMRKKDVSQEAVRRAGLRSIRGKTVTSFDEALAFLDELGNDRIVVKPVSGGASVGVFICENRQQFEQAYRTDLANSSENAGGAGKVLLQEYIDGTEYIVDTVSCSGRHRVTAVMRYTKILLSGKARIYDRWEYISVSDASVREITDYTLKMLDAIGVTYGPVHSEIMVDGNGPVLIEANCRLCGAMMRSTYLDKVLGDHESRIGLNSYLHPEKFTDPEYGTPSRNCLNGTVKFIIINRDIYVEKSMLTQALGNLPGFDYAIGMGDSRLYPKTIDLSTCGGIVYLAHEDRNVLERTIETIHDIEAGSPEVLYKITTDSRR